MSVTIADGQLATVFAKAAGPVQVCSLDGRLLGMFTPWGPPGVTKEQLLREAADHSGKHYTAEEVMAKLRELRCSP